MHANEYKNIKAWYEIIVDIKIDDFVIYQNQYCKIKDLLLEQKTNNTLLFLATEQGAGKFTDDIHMVINPHMKQAAKK